MNSEGTQMTGKAVETHLSTSFLLFFMGLISLSFSLSFCRPIFSFSMHLKGKQFFPIKLSHLHELKPPACLSITSHTSGRENIICSAWVMSPPLAQTLLRTELCTLKIMAAEDIPCWSGRQFLRKADIHYTSLK